MQPTPTDNVSYVRHYGLLRQRNWCVVLPVKRPKIYELVKIHGKFFFGVGIFVCDLPNSRLFSKDMEEKGLVLSGKLRGG